MKETDEGGEEGAKGDSSLEALRFGLGGELLEAGQCRLLSLSCRSLSAVSFWRQASAHTRLTFLTRG